ncbi:MAG: energy transducer TonB, partial [Alphaproteobacteria bacterium]
ARPAPPAPPAATASAAPDVPAPSEPAPSTDAALDAAINDALASVTSEAPAAARPAGPPLTRGERDGLRVAVQRCWNVGSLSTDALATTVVVLVKMAPDGRPESVDLVSSSGGNQTATRRAFEAARRAVIRCGLRGYPLPAEKYAQWREIEMTFDPSNMRIK